MSGNWIKEAFVDMYRLTVLLLLSIISIPSIYSSLSDCFNKNGANITPILQEGLIMTAESSLYLGSEVHEAISQCIIASGR